ncbi:choice-of-anchor Q domain-containing protein [Elusimicrobiota bacterium]
MSLIIVFITYSSGLCATGYKPVIFYSDLTSGPNTGGKDNKGAFVTIWGKNFGDEKGSSYVEIGGGEPDNYLSWSDTEIVFQLGSAAETGGITVTTAFGTSKKIPFTVRSGNIYFVDDSAAGAGAGTYSNPWQSPGSYYTEIVPGDICYFREGEYGGANEYGKTGWNSNMCISTTRTGTAAKPVAFVGYPGETAYFNENTGSLSSNFKCGGADAKYITIAKLKLFASSLCVINTEGQGGDGWRIVGNDCTAVPCLYGVIDSGGDGLKVLGNKIHDSGTLPIDNLQHSIYIGWGSIDFEVAWNTISDNQYGHEIQVHTDNAHTNDYVFKGSVHDNTITAEDTTDARGINVGETGDGSEIEIYNNIIYHCGGNFSGIAIYSGNIKIYNNTLYDINGKMIMLNGEDSHGYDYQRSGKIKNNTFYSSGSLYIGESNGASMSDFVISDNCYYGNGNGPSEDTDPLNSDPKFTDIDNADFRPLKTSPCIDEGYDTTSVVERDHDGHMRSDGKVDIGAFEYTEPVDTEEEEDDEEIVEEIEKEEITIVGPRERKGTINPDKGDKAKIYFKGNKAGNFNCRIFTLDGDLVWEDSAKGTESGMFEWAAKNVSSGSYIVHVKGPGVNSRKKIIVIK